MASASQPTICHLPNEVLVAIFSSLPVPDLARCAGTCKRWHGIVTGFSTLWKGKLYTSYSSPMRSTKTRAVLCALPPFEELIIESGNRFMMRISYPHLLLSEKYVGVMKDFPRVRCEYLSTTLNGACEILFYGSTIDFERLQRLQILPTLTHDIRVPRFCNATRVVRTALSLCPSLRHLSVYIDYVNLYTVKELGQLQSLEIECLRLRKLSFLRHCLGGLEHLKLESCVGLASGEMAKLRQLQNLRRLWLCDSWFPEEDLAAAVAGMDKLESLWLDRCCYIHDLSILQHCGQLRELIITYSLEPSDLDREMPQEQPLQLRLPTEMDFPHRVVGVVVTADDLPAALIRLKELGITGSCHSYLAALSPCSQLRHLCVEFMCEQDKHLSVCVDINLSN